MPESVPSQAAQLWFDWLHKQLRSAFGPQRWQQSNHHWYGASTSYGGRGGEERREGGTETATDRRRGGGGRTDTHTHTHPCFFPSPYWVIFSCSPPPARFIAHAQVSRPTIQITKVSCICIPSTFAPLPSTSFGSHSALPPSPLCACARVCPEDRRWRVRYCDVECDLDSSKRNDGGRSCACWLSARNVFLHARALCCLLTYASHTLLTRWFYPRACVQCSALSQETATSSYVNNFRESFQAVCPSDRRLYGVSSYHSNSQGAAHAMCFCCTQRGGRERMCVRARQ